MSSAYHMPAFRQILDTRVRSLYDAHGYIRGGQAKQGGRGAPVEKISTGERV
jgi:hypothetical protein